MQQTFDLMVIGTGAAGATVAFKCRSAGWNVAIIDSRPFGGTCALRGCDPKKVLVGVAELRDWSCRMSGKGISLNGTEIDWPALIRFKRSFTDPVPDNRENSFSKAGIISFHGRARFVDRNRLQIGDDILTARHVVIATGAMPARLDIPGEQYLTTSEQFMELEQLPPHILFVGGGYISFEFAHVAAQTGARVQIFHRGARPLQGFDPDLVDELVSASHNSGIDIQLNTAIKAIEKSGNHFIVTTVKNGDEKRFEADMAVHGAGRVPEIDDLDLATAGIERDQKGIVVNEYLQSPSNPLVYAAGDAASTAGMPLTPVASMEGDVVARNLLDGNQQKPNYLGIPTVVFTMPPLASVGLLERDAIKSGLKFRVNHQNTSSWYSSRRIGITRSAFKVLIEEDSERILGAHLFGPNAEEIINLFALAIRSGLRATDLRHMVYAYPTNSSDIPYML
jgi:glutathione reductase (NADPH)